jgi:hypothetical protein
MFSRIAFSKAHPSLHVSVPATSRRCWRVSPAMLVRYLPPLGSVLYLPTQPHMSAIDEMPRGMLVERMQLAPLLQTHYLLAASTITSEGPREWIECVDRHGHLQARLYLLPDTDYLAWDALPAGAEAATMSMPAPTHVRWPRNTRSVSAHLLRFHWRQLAGLDVLGAEAATQVSSLSRHLVGQVAGAEAVPLQLALDE